MLDYETYCKMRDHLGRQSLTVAQTARALGLDARTVAKWAEVEQFQPRVCNTPRSSKLDAFKGQIVRWLDTHPYSAQQIYPKGELADCSFGSHPSHLELVVLENHHTAFNWNFIWLGNRVTAAITAEHVPALATHLQIRPSFFWTLQISQQICTAAYLFTSNYDRDNWPGRGFFEEAFEAFVGCINEDAKRLLSPWFTRLFWLQPGDFKMAVANMPMMCALWATTSTSRQWWGHPTHRLMIRRIRDFDPVWFEQCFRQSCAVLMAIHGLIKPQTFVKIPA